LESNEKLAQAKFKGNTWAAWSVTTKKHQKFIEAVVASKCHIITTVRSKTDTIQTEDKKIKKVGLKEIQREGYEYELTLNFNLDRDGHLAIASKDRTGLFIEADPFVIDQETGKTLLNWANSGVDQAEMKRKQKESALEDLREVLEKKGKDEDLMVASLELNSLSDLSIDQIQQWIKKLSNLPDADEVKQKETAKQEIDLDEVDEAIEKQVKKPSKKYKETIQ